MSDNSSINNLVNMQIRGEYPAEPPPAYEDARHHPSTRALDLPPSDGIAGAPSATSETPSTDRNGLLGELLDRFSEPDSDPNPAQQEPQQPNLPPIGDHKIQTDVLPPSPAPETSSSEPIPQQDRNRSINTGSKPLSGTFPLYDSLSLLTHSGALVATVLPHPANPLRPKPAELKVHSHSGSIHLETEIPNPNEIVQRERGSFRRTYRTSVTSHSSRIEARVVVGEKTVVQSHSGMLGVEMVVPCLPLLGGGEDGEGDGGGEGGKEGKKETKPRPASSEQLSLHTQTHSSSQEVRIVAHGTPALSREGFTVGIPQQQQEQQQQVLTSYHHTHSGKLRLHYPATWTGRIEGTIGKPTSQISIHGSGVDVIQQTPHRFLAKRRTIGGQNGAAEEEGMMANTLRFYSFSGLVEIFFD